MPPAASHTPQPRLLVDVSEIRHRDHRTGISRVVREVLRSWLSRPPSGFAVEPIRFGRWRGGAFTARAWAAEALGAAGMAGRPEEPVTPADGDVFMGLDFNLFIGLQSAWLRRFRAQGMRTCFLCHDLLPLQTPQFYRAEFEPEFAGWFDHLLRHADGIACVSRSVMEDVAAWHRAHPPGRAHPLALGWFHNGANPLAAAKGEAKDPGIPGLDMNRPVFLMVGAVVPRKGHGQALSAFEKLWEGGIDAQLVVIGQPGWMMQAWVERARAHPELGKRFFWPGHVSDQQLQAIYRSSTALVAASEAEGFGLPLIEAAQYGLPVIARDMPIFREVAGEHAFFFQGKTPEELAAALGAWLALHAEGKAPASSGMKWLSWDESAARLGGLATSLSTLWKGGENPWSMSLPGNGEAAEAPAYHARYALGRLAGHPADFLAAWAGRPRAGARLVLQYPGNFLRGASK